MPKEIPIHENLPYKIYKIHFVLYNNAANCGIPGRAVPQAWRPQIQVCPQVLPDPGYLGGLAIAGHSGPGGQSMSGHCGAPDKARVKEL